MSLYSLAGLDVPEGKAAPTTSASVRPNALRPTTIRNADDRAQMSGWSGNTKVMAPPVLSKKAASVTATTRVPASGAKPRSSPAASDASVATAGGICACASGGTNMTATTWYKDIKQPYDPAHPNDYDEWVKEVETIRKQRELEAALQRKKEETSRAFSSLASAGVGGADEPAVGAKRPRSDSSPAFGAGQAPPPPPLPLPPPPPPLAPGFNDESGDPGLSMLQKMGWSEGQGLGKEGQGMRTPLMAKKSDGRTGVIVNASERPPPPPPLPGPPPPPSGGPGAASGASGAAGVAGAGEKKGAVTFRGRPSRVLLLKNMVAPADVDAELRAEIGEECSKMLLLPEPGILVKALARQHSFSVTVHLMGADSGLPDEESVRIFVKFGKQAAAMKAYIDLDGRYFGGRQVWVCFYREQEFDGGNLAPNANEPK